MIQYFTSLGLGFTVVAVNNYMQSGLSSFVPVCLRCLIVLFLYTVVCNKLFRDKKLSLHFKSENAESAGTNPQ